MTGRILIALSMMSLVSCAGNGPRYSENLVQTIPANMAKVVFYRDVLPLAGAAWPHHYYVDNQLVAQLKIGGFTRVLVTPGAHTIQSGPASNPNFRSASLRAEGGTTYFFRERGTVPPDFSPVPAAQAQHELESGYHYQPPVVSVSR